MMMKKHFNVSERIYDVQDMPWYQQLYANDYADGKLPVYLRFSHDG
jgi:hypothetical protein